MPLEIMILITAVIFTVFGLLVGYNKGIVMGVVSATTMTIDTLIAEKFIKTKMVNGQETLIPYTEYEESDT